MKCMTSPMCGELSVSERRIAQVALVPLPRAVQVGELRTTWDSLTDRLLLLDLAVPADLDVGGDFEVRPSMSKTEAVATAGGVDLPRLEINRTPPARSDRRACPRRPALAAP